MESIGREMLARGFANPPTEYGPIDGWWWEAGELDREKLRWQIEEFKDKGIVGTWFYARYLYGEPLGSQPGYMSPGWWEFTSFAAEEHKRLGMIDWFSNWTALQFEQDAIRSQRDRGEPELWGRRLVLHRGRPRDDGSVRIDVPEGDEILDSAAYRLTDHAIDHASRIDLNDAVDGRTLVWAASEAGWEVLVVAARPWDLDYVNPEIGRRWTDVILGQYERNLGGQLGDVVQAFGPDEMELLNGTTFFSPDVLDRVSAELGQDARPLLVGMFVDIGQQTSRIRANYHGTVGSLLGDRFYDAPTQWLHDRGMLHVTLSQRNEDAIAHAFHHGDFFRYLRTFDAPGNEDPLQSPPGGRRLFRTKISSSVAHLYERQRVIVLAHYASGWGHTPEENVGWTNEAYAKGANLYSRHLGSYSLLGGWYEYVPPHDHFFHPYWRYWRTFADYVRRLSFVMSQGVHRADVALLYPLTTIHAHWKAVEELDSVEADGVDRDPFGRHASSQVFEPFAFEVSKALEDLAIAIYHAGIDFDFVDDPSLDRAEVRGKVLTIGGLEFRSVVLPPMSTVRRSTMEKIAAFHDAGGAVAAFGRLPTDSVEAGGEDPALKELVDRVFGPDGSGVLIEDDVAGLPPALSNAIRRDVVASEPMIFHTHQHVEDGEIYLIFNASDDAREVTVDLRASGTPTVWDCFTGQIRRAEGVTHTDDRTQVALSMGPSQAMVLVLGPEEAGTVEAATRLDESLEPVTLAGPFRFQLEPTMNNRWGDFRYPASDDLIGAEARRFRYREEHDGSGIDSGWHQPEYDDSSWTEVQYSHGPYWSHLGPFADSEEPGGLLERVLEGDRSLAWERYSYSKRFGTNRRVGYTGFAAWFNHLLGVSDNFLVLDETTSREIIGDPLPELEEDAPEGGVQGNHHHYMATTVMAPEDRTYSLRIGRTKNHPELSGLDQDSWIPHRVAPGTRAWVNGEQVLSVGDEDASEVAVDVPFRAGPNRVLLRAAHEDGAHTSGYVVLLDGEPEETDPTVPQLRWFRKSSGPVLDVEPERAHPVGWYRFTAPPGTRVIRFMANARAAEGWVGGGAVAVGDDGISLDVPVSGPTTVALRIEQERGTYEGAVFDEPIRFETDEGTIELGDWSAQGLATYSGIGVYSIEVDLTAEQIASKVVLDLGGAMAVAEVIVNGTQAAVLLGRPYEVDITRFVQEGPNRLEVKVANTLANHMSTYPTKWVFEGQTVSGLLGPVRLRFLAPIG